MHQGLYSYNSIIFLKGSMNIRKAILKIGGNSINVTSLDNGEKNTNCRALPQQTTT